MRRLYKVDCYVDRPHLAFGLPRWRQRRVFKRGLADVEDVAHAGAVPRPDRLGHLTLVVPTRRHRHYVIQLNTQYLMFQCSMLQNDHSKNARTQPHDNFHKKEKKILRAFHHRRGCRSTASAPCWGPCRRTRTRPDPRLGPSPEINTRER